MPPFGLLILVRVKIPYGLRLSHERLQRENPESPWSLHIRILTKNPFHTPLQKIKMLSY